MLNSPSNSIWTKVASFFVIKTQIRGIKTGPSIGSDLVYPETQVAWL